MAIYFYSNNELIDYELGDTLTSPIRAEFLVSDDLNETLEVTIEFADDEIEDVILPFVATIEEKHYYSFPHKLIKSVSVTQFIGEFGSVNNLFRYDIRNTSGNSTYDSNLYKQPIHDAFNRWEEIIVSRPYSSYFLYVDIDFANLSESLLGDANITKTYSIDHSNDFGKTFSTEGTFQLNIMYLDVMLETTDSNNNTEMYYVALHEIGHLLGIGKISFADASINSKPIVEYVDENDGTTKKYYNGENAVAKYKEYFPCYEDFLIGVPIEDSGDANTKDINFEEGDLTLQGDINPISTNDRFIDGQFHPGLGNELMTPWTIGVYPLPISKITIGVLHDMGFGVDYDKADIFVPPDPGYYFTTQNKTFFYQIENTSGNSEFDDCSYIKPIQDAFKRWDEIITETPWQDYQMVIYVGYAALEAGVLGGASPYEFGTLGEQFLYGSTFTMSGQFQLNTLYLKNMRDNIVDETLNISQLYTTTLHEIGHIIGIGPYTFSWSEILNKPVSSYTDANDGKTKYYYTGSNAFQYYKTYYPDYSSNLVGIPIEDDGGSGTALSHPEEGRMGTISSNDRYINGNFHPGLQHELMTGWSDSGINLPLSKITIGFLEDIGYGVDYTKADEFIPIVPTPTPELIESQIDINSFESNDNSQDYIESINEINDTHLTHQEPINSYAVHYNPYNKVSSAKIIKEHSECSCNNHGKVKLADFKYELRNLIKFRDSYSSASSGYYLYINNELQPYTLGNIFTPSVRAEFFVSDIFKETIEITIEFADDEIEDFVLPFVATIENKHYYSFPHKLIKSVDNTIPGVDEETPTPTITPSPTSTPSPTHSPTITIFEEEPIDEYIYDSMEAVSIIGGDMEGQSIVGYNDRVLTTFQGVNGVTGLTLENNIVTLTKQGRYYIKARTSASKSESTYTAIKFLSGDYANEEFLGPRRYARENMSQMAICECSIVVEITQTTTFKIQTKVGWADAQGLSAGESNLFVQKLASSTNNTTNPPNTILSARISANGNIVSQKPEWIESCTRTAPGKYDIVYKSLYFTEIPSITVTADVKDGVSHMLAEYNNPTKHTITINTIKNNDSASDDTDFTIIGHNIDETSSGGSSSGGSTTTNNVVSAVIEGDGTITSSSDDWIESVVVENGAMTINFVSNYFTQTPSIATSIDHQDNASHMNIEHNALSKDRVQIIQRGMTNSSYTTLGQFTIMAQHQDRVSGGSSSSNGSTKIDYAFCKAHIDSGVRLRHAQWNFMTPDADNLSHGSKNYVYDAGSGFVGLRPPVDGYYNIQGMIQYDGQAGLVTQWTKTTQQRIIVYKRNISEGTNSSLFERTEAKINTINGILTVEINEPNVYLTTNDLVYAKGYIYNASYTGTNFPLNGASFLGLTRADLDIISTGSGSSTSESDILANGTMLVSSEVSSLENSIGISSVARTALGTFKFTLTTPIQDANYNVFANTIGSSICVAFVMSKTANDFTIETRRIDHANNISIADIDANLQFVVIAK